MVKTTYELYGYIEATTYYGGRGYKWLVIKTDEHGLERIKKEPRQDYINFGFQSVDYARFEVYKIEEWKKDGYLYSRKSLEPIEIIEDGQPQFDSDVVVEESFYPAVINY